MKRYQFFWGVALGLGSVVAAGSVQALPGQSVDEVSAWIQTHPTLQPASGETLLIRKSDTPARRFTFEALITSPVRATMGEPANVIQMEQLSFFDRINGISRNRLVESLQVIYGAPIYQDFQQAGVVYEYPSLETVITAENQDAPLLEYLQGEVRQGDRYTYWLELAETREGMAYSGRISVLMPGDVEKLIYELQRR